MLNKFIVFPCIKQSNDSGYEGLVVTLACASNMSFVLFFPMSEDNAKLINYVLDHKPSEYTTNQNIIGIYKTMIDSWESGGRFLSGVSLDTEFDPESGEETIAVKLIISDESGSVDSIIKVNFIHAILLASMERREILVSSELLKKLMPSDDKEDGYTDGDSEDDDTKDIKDSKATKEESKCNKKCPVDKDILDIAKKIMSGKIK